LTERTPFSERIQVWAARREAETLDPSGLRHIVECGTEFGIPVVQHVTALAECFSSIADSIASHLRHPGFGRMSGDAGEGHPPGLQVEKRRGRNK
jgi:hypothetical protein